jgi:hypothetical protein
MKQLTNIIVAALVLFIVFREFGCGGSADYATKADTVVVRDTAWQKYDSIVVKKVPVKSVIHDTLPPEYLPNPAYDSLKVQYEELAKEFLAKKIYSDTFRVPQIKGTFVVSDTVKNNELFGRSWTADYMLPTVKETITITKPVPPKRQLYIGGGIIGSKTEVQSINAGILYKSKKDRILGISAGINQQFQPQVGVSVYWKLF